LPPLLAAEVTPIPTDLQEGETIKKFEHEHEHERDYEQEIERIYVS